ncbi:MAG: PQQ-binding-like beta-propeller repeat protein [Deltaproteobacteria bacterium]|nr:MAG: PQQ-binding-like beta-propeller repeat protein [Deltaproteobacteria bacterium]
MIGLTELGELAWEREFEHDEIRIFFPYGNDLFLDGTAARKLHSVTGETLVEKGFGFRIQAFHPIASGPIYWSRESGIWLGLDPDTLDIVWQWPDPQGEFGVFDAYLWHYDNDGEFRLVDYRTGEDIVRVQGPPHEESGMGQNIVGDMFIQFYDKERIAFNIHSGDLVWRKQEPDFGFHERARFQGHLAFCGTLGLSAYDLRTGAVSWRQRFEGGSPWLSCNPTVEHERIYVGTNDGCFHILDLQTGEVLLSHQQDFEPNVVKPTLDKQVVVGSLGELACYQLT